MPIATCRDLQVRWDSVGSGETLVLISGLGGDSTFWGADAPALAEHFRVVTYDPRGTGDTVNPGGDYTIGDLADDLASLLDALEIPRAHILGFSMGGTVAQEFALRYPGRVSKLILAATFARTNPQSGAFLDGVLDIYREGGRPGQMFNLIYPWLFSLGFLRDPGNEMWWQYDESTEKQTFDDWRRQYEAQRAFDGTGRLSELDAPTLVLAGELDRLSDTTDSALLADRIPGAVMVVIPAVGHLMNVESPDQFRREIVDFLLGQ